MIDLEIRDRYKKANEFFIDAINKNDWGRCITIIENSNSVLFENPFAVVSTFCRKPVFAAEIIEQNKRRIDWFRKLLERERNA